MTSIFTADDTGVTKAAQQPSETGAVAGDVGGKDRGEFSFHRWDGHLAAPLGDEYSRRNRRIGMFPIGLREATPAATNAVCQRLVDYRGDEPGAAGFRCDDEDSCWL